MRDEREKSSEEERTGKLEQVFSGMGGYKLEVVWFANFNNVVEIEKRFLIVFPKSFIISMKKIS